MPEVIAQQFESAGQNEKAVQYWQQAGERDLRRFAMKELIAHYSSALRVIAAMPDTPQRSALELGICLGLGHGRVDRDRPQLKEGGELPAGAVAQPHAAREWARAFPRHWGVWFNVTTTGRRRGSAFADELVAIARELDNPICCSRPITPDVRCCGCRFPRA